MLDLGVDTIAILGRPNFMCAKIARRLHDLKLYNVAEKAEDEQAAAIHFLLDLHQRHGDSWREVADKILKDDKI